MNLNNPVYGYTPLDISAMTECNGELLITLNNKECYNIYPGQKLIFKRFVYENDGEHFVLTEYVDVLSEDENHTIHTTIPINGKKMLYSGIENVKYVSGYTDEGEIYEYHIIKCREAHNIFPQDAALQEIYIKDYEGNLLGTYSGITIPLKRADRAATSADCITFVESQETCGKERRKMDFYKYDFLPERISRDSIIVTGFNEDICDKMAYIEVKHNPFYFYFVNIDEKTGEPTEYNEYNEPVKHCYLYWDSWWDSINDIKSNKQKIVNYGSTRAILGVNNAYWNVSLGLSAFANETTLGSSDTFGLNFVNDLEESLAPEVIDMERVKYSPMVFDKGKKLKTKYKWSSPTSSEYPYLYTDEWLSVENTEYGKEISLYENVNNEFIKTDFNGEWQNGVIIAGEDYYYQTNEVYREDLTIATSITLNFHFRERMKVDSATCKTNSTLTSGNVYFDGWYINTNSGDTIWWNGMDYTESAFSETKFLEFLKNSGETSDLLGYLNFTDNDVFYRKKKVSQSFIRLSFFNSTDPIEQKLLYYSTIFLDGTNLYGKYIKQLMFMEENDLFNAKKNKELNLNAAVVFCSSSTVSARVDTQMVVTNEFDKTKSAEGFNLYLFAEDTTFGVDENGEKTIYMKVEFNHAGNGKTIPMIMWPKNENTYVPLTVNNFIDSLYIPIKLTYINGKYAYYIEDAYKNEDGNISLVLFEPKLDFIEDEGEDNGQN